MRDSNQYKPQTGKYKIKVKEGADWKLFDKARLQISVGQPNHESDKFESTMEWSLNRFSSLTVCVNDTLQKYTIAFEKGVDISLAEKISYEAGTQWIRRNHDILKDARVKVVRWDEWLNHPSFKNIHEKFLWLYQNNKLFKGAIDENIDVFWSRRAKNNSNLYHASRFNDFFSLSRDYLLEELAIFSIMGSKNAAVDIYPGAILIPLQICEQAEHFGQEKEMFSSNFTRIDFARNN